MKRFEKILVYVEQADARALQQVVDLAVAHKASLSVCDVVPDAPSVPDPDGILPRLETLAVRHAYERLQKLCRPFTRHVPIDIAIVGGVPFLAVIEEVVQQGFDLVVHISARSEHGLNPTGMHLVRKCPCAVWSLSSPRIGGPKNVVIAVDRRLDKEGASTTAMAIEQATVASVMSPDDELRVHVVHAWRPYAENLLDSRDSGLPASDIRAFIDAQREDHERWLFRLADILAREAPSCTIETHLERGDVAEVVKDVVGQTDADLVVIGTVGTSTIPGVLIGTSAEAILSQTDVPVLTLKPDYFATPLQFDGHQSGREVEPVLYEVSK